MADKTVKTKEVEKKSGKLTQNPESQEEEIRTSLSKKTSPSKAAPISRAKSAKTAKTAKTTSKAASKEKKLTAKHPSPSPTKVLVKSDPRSLLGFTKEL